MLQLCRIPGLLLNCWKQIQWWLVFVEKFKQAPLSLQLQGGDCRLSSSKANNCGLATIQLLAPCIFLGKYCIMNNILLTNY